MQKIFYYIILIFIIIKCDAQWEQLPAKTKLTYSFQRIKILENSDTGGLKDDTLIGKKEIISFTLDKIINLTGNNRKLFVFSKCLNYYLFNGNSFIEKIDNVDSSDYSFYFIIPVNEEDSDNNQYIGKKQTTIFYRLNNFIYNITVPLEFTSKYLSNRKNINEFDNSIIESTDSFYQIIKTTHIKFHGLALPINSFLCLKKVGVIKNNYNECNRKESYVYVKTSKNRLFGTYSELYREENKNIYGNIQLTPYYGITKSVSTVYSNSHLIAFTNYFNLIKIELPKK